MASATSTKLSGRTRRKRRIRKKVSGTSERPRLSVFRSARHIYAQVIDDADAKTLLTVSTLSKDLQGAAQPKSEAAKRVGEQVARACLDRGIKQVVFDRNGFLYHGRVRSLADAARGAGLDF